MSFNRQLFKEAYKAGYKKARLNEAAGNNVGVNFIKSLDKAYPDGCKIVVSEFDRKGNFTGEYEGHLYYSGLEVTDGRRTLMIIKDKNIEKIQPFTGAVCLTLDNGYRVMVSVYTSVNFVDDPFWQERFAIGRGKN